jgi:G3E family GTPase
VEAVPAVVVAGFLGAGKTTLVDRLLRAARAEGVRLAIVSNEFGDTGIDRALLDAGEEGFVELDGGCVCCRLSDALSDTLETLIAKVRPDRLVLECSGVALPGEIVVQFWRPPLSELISEETVVVVVDAERAAADAEPDPTFLEQLAAADVVVLNKRDLVDDVGLARARERVDRWTGGQPQLVATHADVDLALLFPPEARRRPRQGETHPHDHDRFGTTELRFADGVAETEVLRQVRAQGSLRAKGFVRTDQGLRVVQGVGPRITLAAPSRPVPEALVGIVVVIHREDA